MKTRYVARVAVLAALFLGSGVARAESLDFSYHWSSSPAVVTGTNPSQVTGSELSSGSVAFALTPAGTASLVLGGDPGLIPGATLTTTGSAPESDPDSFASPFSLTLHLLDAASGASGELTFVGAVNGTLTATTSTLTADFSSPLTRQLTLGQHVYSVSIEPPSTAIPPPGLTTPPGSIGARVQVAPLQTPEPSALLLAAFAVPLLYLAGPRTRVSRK
jgi:hypothetical protein